MLFGIFGLGPTELVIIAVVLLVGAGVVIWVTMSSGKGE